MSNSGREPIEIHMAFGRGVQQLTVDAGTLLRRQPRAADAGAVRQALDAPIGTPRLSGVARPSDRVVVMISDITRPCPTTALLPPILGELAQAGVSDAAIKIIVARGIHRAHTADERARLVGPDVARRFTVIDSDPSDVASVGRTRRGTPVEVFRAALDADLRIGVGNVELHYFAGYTGGAKALMPGASSAATISHNHALAVSPQARAGILHGNPVREDLEEAAAMVGLHFILNVVVGSGGQIVAAAAGDFIRAHRAACRVVDEISRPPIADLADLVIVSAGGYPKDINLYQAQKALDAAAGVVRPGGIILLVAECGEGFGHPLFEEWLSNHHPAEVLARLRAEFTLGGHKAAAVARVLLDAEVWLVSALPSAKVAACGIRPFSALDQALREARRALTPESHVVVIPEGSGLLPTVSREGNHAQTGQTARR